MMEMLVLLYFKKMEEQLEMILCNVLDWDSHELRFQTKTQQQKWFFLGPHLRFGKTL